MKTIDDTAEIEKAIAEKFAAETPPFEGVAGITVELGEDHSGEPAIWLVFRLNQTSQTDLDWIRRFNDYASDLQFKIIHSKLSRFPYTRIRKAA